MIRFLCRDLVQLFLAERPAHELEVRGSEVEPVLGDEAAHERETVGVKAGGLEPDQGIARLRGRSFDEIGALDHADTEAGQVEGVGRQQPGMLGGLATDEGTAGFAAAGHDPAHEGCHCIWIEVLDGDVVEEEEGRGAETRDVVGAHRHQVDADRVVSPDARGDRRLRPDPIGRRDEDRIAQALGHRHGGREAAEAGEHVRAEGRFDVLANAGNGFSSGGHVDPGTAIRLARHDGPAIDGCAAGSAPSSSSRMNLWLATSYGTGTG